MYRMSRSGPLMRTTKGLFVTYAAISLVPVLLLGVALAASYRSEARQRGIAVGRSEAALVAHSAIEPLLDGRPLSAGLNPIQTQALARLVNRDVRAREILRMRLRDLAGHVVFSDDGSGFKQRPEDEAIAAAHGHVVELLTRLNVDSNDSGPAGPAAVEVYEPLTAGAPLRRVGVLEIYLPYAPIDADVSAGLHNLYRNLAAGLGALYLALFAISVSVSRHLRRQVRVNKYMAEHDSLTDLPNRALFHQKVEEALALGARTAGHTVIAIMDLDRFKEVNDTLGHHSGDELLTQLARRLADNMRPGDAVARLGGDEFGVILSDVVEPEAILQRLRAVVEHEVEVNGLPLSVESSIGFVVAPEDGTDADEMLQRADVAMYLAKTRHLGVARYDSTKDHYDAANLGLVSELRRAIERDELELHYQPKAALGDGRVEAVEALVRWNHPTEGLLYPDRFVPLAEQTDIIDKLTRWVLRQALADLADLEARGIRIAVAVNVSARNLAKASFADDVVAVLDATGVGAESLVVEITETALLSDPQRAAEVLAQLDGIGVRVSLDDFGMGQTSLGYLATLPVHELKIDKSFVSDMLENQAHAAIVRSIVDLGHNLSLSVVGEGVETDSVLSSLEACGCDLAQGFLLARPMPIEELHAHLSSIQAGIPISL